MLLRQEVQLLFRGKLVVDARGLVAFAKGAQAIPGLSEAAERIQDYFDDPDAGNWVDGSDLYRIARTDHVNRLKRIWRDFDHRRTTLRQYLSSETAGPRESETIRFKFPEASMLTPKAFVATFQHLVGGLDRLCRLIVGDGFSVAAFREPSGWIVLQTDSEDVQAVAASLLGHCQWFRDQAQDVRRLEERASISDEYAKAARSLASAQLRHLRVLAEETVREFSRQPDAQVDRAVTMATEYVAVVDKFARGGADVRFPAPEASQEAA